MNARAASLVPSIALALCCAVSRPAAAGPWSLAPGEYYSELAGSDFSTTSAYDRAGNRQPYGRRFEDRTFSTMTQLGWRKPVNLLLGLTARNASMSPGSLLPSEARTGLSDLTLGLHWKVLNGAQGLALETGWTLPMGYDRKLSAILGDGRSRVFAGLDAGTALGSRAFVQASVGGFRRYLRWSSTDSSFNADPAQTSANFARFGADAGVWVTDRLLVGGRWAGQTVLSSQAANKDDELDATLQRLGGLLLLRVDDRIDLLAGSWHTASGKNTWHADQYYVAVAFKQSKLSRLQGFLGGARR